MNILWHVPAASAPSQASSNARAAPEELTGISVLESQVATTDTSIAQTGPEEGG